MSKPNFKVVFKVDTPTPEDLVGKKKKLKMKQSVVWVKFTRTVDNTTPDNNILISYVRTPKGGMYTAKG